MALPSCSCLQFRRSHLPCKHFAAIFEHFDDIDFLSLPKFFTSNPMLTVDLSYLHMKEENMITANTTITYMDSVINEEEGNETVNSQTEELDPNTQQLERSAKRVREVLSKIKTLTYLVESEDLLEKTKTDFESILKNLYAGCRNDLGLALETQPSKSAKKRKSTPSLKKLPSRKKKKMIILTVLVH